MLPSVWTISEDWFWPVMLYFKGILGLNSFQSLDQLGFGGTQQMIQQTANGQLLNPWQLQLQIFWCNNYKDLLTILKGEHVIGRLFFGELLFTNDVLWRIVVQEWCSVENCCSRMMFFGELLFKNDTYGSHFSFLQPYRPDGISPMENSGLLPRGKPLRQSCYPTYGACWVF